SGGRAGGRGCLPRWLGGPLDLQVGDDGKTSEGRRCAYGGAALSYSCNCFQNCPVLCAGHFFNATAGRGRYESTRARSARALIGNPWNGLASAVSASAAVTPPCAPKFLCASGLMSRMNPQDLRHTAFDLINSAGLYCAAILLARITSPQSLISRLSNALAAAGVSSSGGYGSMPPSAKVCCALGSASAARNALLSLSMIGCGVPAGASSMCQKSMSS